MPYCSVLLLAAIIILASAKWGAPFGRRRLVNTTLDTQWNWSLLGTIVAINGDTRAPAAPESWMEISVPSSLARSTMRRPPDFENARIVSWGNLSWEEAHRLVAEEDRAHRQDTLDDLRRL